MSGNIRSISSIDIYHIIFRGSGKQIIFEDNDDRLLFLRLLNKYVKELDGEVYAWTLMSDHVHIVLHMPLGDIAILMKKIGATYFRNFNDKSNRSGHVLQDRYHSEAINTDEYLMTCVRYVHQNIEKASVCKMEEYEWSSHRDYVGVRYGSSPLDTETDFVLAVFEGIENYAIFHSQRNYAVPCIDVGKSGKRMTDDEALIYAKSLLGDEVFYHLKEMDKPIRDSKLRLLKEHNLTGRQIGRLTGIGEATIRRA